MITFDNTRLEYKNKLLFENLSFDIGKSEKAALAGPSGSGKSSIMNLIMGFSRPAAGRIYFEGEELSQSNIREMRKKLCWLPQNVSIIGSGPVRNVIKYPFNFRENRHITPSEQEIESVLEDLLLEASILDSSFSEISGGEKQRIGAAICLLLKRPAMLLDEPTSALDKESKKAILDAIFSQKELTVIAATHDDFFLDKCDKIIDLTNA